MERRSPEAAKRLLDAAADNDGNVFGDVEEAMGETDCPRGCYVEPDGHCPHGYESAALTAGLI